MRGWLLALLLVASGFAGCIGSEDVAPTNAREVQGDQPTIPTNGSAVVIAVVDSGVNLYHSEYQAPERWPGSPNGTGDISRPNATGGATTTAPSLHDRLDLAPPAVELTRDAEDWESAVEADKERLMETIEPKTLYTFPGTKILGAISFQGNASDWPLILDHPGGHGTMTSSRAVGNTVAVGGEDPGIWLVMVQGFTPEAVTWAAEQSWIDMISISSGLSIGGLVPAVANVEAQAAIEAFDEASHAKPLFASSGNGLGNARLAGFPAWLRGASGVPDAVSVGATDNGNIVQWHNQDSYIAADGCANPAAVAASLDEVADSGGGTSSATPYSAGAGAKMLIEARRLLNDTTVGPRVDEDRSVPRDAWDSGYAGDADVILAKGDGSGIESGPLADGVFTMREFKDVLYHTALVTPTEDDSDGRPCPIAGVPPSTVAEDARFPFQGYGEVNVNSTQAAIDVLKGKAELPQRSTDDLHYQRAHALKETLVTKRAPDTPTASLGQP